MHIQQDAGGYFNISSFNGKGIHFQVGVNKKPQKFIFEYWVFSQKSCSNMAFFEKIHICITKIRDLHT